MTCGTKTLTPRLANKLLNLKSITLTFFINVYICIAIHMYTGGSHLVGLPAFVNLIPVAEQCSSTARIGPHPCGHRTGAVLSSDKHWHAVLEHCFGPMPAVVRSSAGSARALLRHRNQVYKCRLTYLLVSRRIRMLLSSR